MIDSLTGSLTAFDAIAVAVIVLSALMALSRGFMRELATLGAFIAALAVAYYTRLFFRDSVASILPDGASALIADAITVGGAFLIVYIGVTWVGNRLSSTIQGLEGITFVDRMIGFIFGAVRGFIAVIFFVMLLGNSLSRDSTPPWITDAATYPFFENIAAIVNSNAPRVADDVEDRLQNRTN